MRRVGGLWEKVVSFENLHEAARRAALGKRKRPDVAAFLLNVEQELVRLRRELQSHAYQPGAYREFLVQDAKQRLISAAPFRDRVVHHAVTQVLEPIFELRFTRDSYACRVGMGVHKALERAKRAVLNYPCVLKCDVRKYFASIDHEILKELLARAIKCKPTLELAGRIIDGWDSRDETASYFPGDDLFAPFARRRGLPLGNQTSQFFANVYLNPLDHFVLQHLRPQCYIRYVDDFILFGESQLALDQMKDSIDRFLERFRICIHSRKSRVYRCADGITFLGWRLSPGRTRLVRGNVIGFRHRLREMKREFEYGSLDLDGVRQRIQAWIGHARFGDTWHLRKRIFAGFTLQMGRAAGAARGRMEQQSRESPRFEP